MSDDPQSEMHEDQPTETRPVEESRAESATRRIDPDQLFAALEPEPEPIPPPSPTPAEAQAAPTAEPTQYIDEPPAAPPTRVASVIEPPPSPQPSAEPSQFLAAKSDKPAKDNRSTVAIIVGVVVVLLACICACTTLGVIAILANTPNF